MPEALLAKGFRRAALDFLVKNEALSEEFRDRMLTWRHGGFSAHNEINVAAEDAEGRKKLAGYMLRAPMFLQKMTYDAATIPNSVKVGDVGIIGTITLYTNRTKTVGDGREDYSFVVERDTASTANFNLITKSYNSSSQLLETEQDRYRITSTGALTDVSVDIQSSTTSTIHPIFR